MTFFWNYQDPILLFGYSTDVVPFSLSYPIPHYRPLSKYNERLGDWKDGGIETSNSGG